MKKEFLEDQGDSSIWEAIQKRIQQEASNQQSEKIFSKFTLPLQKIQREKAENFNLKEKQKKNKEKKKIQDKKLP